MFWMTTRRPFFRGGFSCWGGQWGGSVDSCKVGTRWIFLTSEVWGVQELCSARIASRWSADTDFGRRGAVPTAGVVVVSFLGGEGVGKVKPAKMCRTKNRGKVPTRGNIWWLDEEVEELDDLMTFFSPQKMNQVEACEVKDLKLFQDEEDVNSLDGHGGSAWSRVSSLQCCWGPGIPP